MEEKDLDIVELMIQKMPEETEEQIKIKKYMQMHKTNCNHFIYSNYSRETTFFNTILKSLMLDLGREIVSTIHKKEGVC